MKRNRLPRRARQTPDSELLTRLATRLSQSSNRIEDAYWETRLATHTDPALGLREANRLRLLTALREGAQGARGLNARI